MKICAYIDGLTEPRNPGGVAAYGISIILDGEEIKTFKGVIGEGAGMSNNVAEYGALIALCKVLAGFGMTPYHEVQIKGDSQLVINQMRGIWRIKSGMYVKWAEEAMSLLKELQVKYQWVVYLDWIPREQNVRADQLSREAYEGYCKERGMKVKYMDDRVALQVERIAAAKKDPSRAAWEAKNKEAFTKIYENPSPTVMESLKGTAMTPLNSVVRDALSAKDTCENCKWLKWRGPHVGCFPDGKYRKWLPKSSIKTNKCEDHAKR